ncbi:MAG TPA: 3-oxoacyl-ACP reductase family protein [Solirubrobacterales bacterium]|nr:3-oxoacyl-ACP reductase family protein [Solirubrobacterales bacterium]
MESAQAVDRSAPLAGRTALVTGGSRGIGAAISRELNAAGADVAVNYRSDRAAAEAVLADLGEGASAWQADVADGEAVSKMVDEVTARHGGLDVLVVNAGVWRGGPIDRLAPADWSLVVDTSLTGAYHLVRAALPRMKEAGFGRVIVVSSAIGLIGFPGDGAYAAAKAGLLGFVKSISKEGGRDGVTVNAVAPGFVETDMTGEVPERARERMLSRTSLRRPGTPEEIALAVRFLACEGSYVTGQTLVVDGGLSL